MKETRNAEGKLEAEARSRRGVNEAMVMGPAWLRVLRRAMTMAAKPPTWDTLLILPIMVPLRDSPA